MHERKGSLNHSSPRGFLLPNQIGIHIFWRWVKKEIPVLESRGKCGITIFLDSWFLFHNSHGNAEYMILHVLRDSIMEFFNMYFSLWNAILSRLILSPTYSKRLSRSQQAYLRDTHTHTHTHKQTVMYIWMNTKRAKKIPIETFHFSYSLDSSL